MPGFSIVSSGKGKSFSTNEVKPIYNYNWVIEQLFGDSTGESDATIYARDCTLPSYSFTKEEVKGSFVNYKYASSINWEDVKVTFYDVQELYQKLKSWRQSITGPLNDMRLRSAGTYKKLSKINVECYDGTPAYTWNLHGSWPSEIREGDLTYTSSDAKLVDMTITYDYAEYDDKSGGQGSSGGGNRFGSTGGEPISSLPRLTPPT